MRHICLSPRDQRILAAAYEKGASSYELSEKYKIAQRTVLNICRTYGVPIRSYGETRRRFNDETEREIAMQYRNGASSYQLADFYRCSVHAIVSICQRQGVARRSRSEALVLRHKFRHRMLAFKEQGEKVS